MKFVKHNENLLGCGLLVIGRTISSQGLLIEEDPIIFSNRGFIRGLTAGN